MKIFRLKIMAGSLCLSLTPACAAGAQTAVELAKLKPTDFLARAAGENGLGSLNTPWHVVVHFESFDPAGTHKNAGTFEEWWFGPKSYKSIYKSDLLNHTDVATENGLFRSGDQAWPTNEDLAGELVRSPVAVGAPNLKQSELVTQIVGAGDSEMHCISSFPSHRPDQHIGSNMPRDLSALPSACFAKNSVILRSRSTGPGNPVLVFNKIVLFEGKYVSTDAAFVESGKPLFTAQVIRLERIPDGAARPEPVEGSEGPLRGPIEPPGDWVHVASGQSEYLESVIHAIPPNQSTEVKLKITITPEGRVRDVAVISGPPQFAALVAKETYKLSFEPITILGTPVEATVLRRETFNTTAGAPFSFRTR